MDSPISFTNPWNKTVWSPQNYDYKYLGPIPLRRAIEQSRNVPAVKTLQAEGVETGIDYARKLGLAGELPPYLPIALGAGEATLQEMVGAFSTFANQGLRMKPMLITRITDREGNVIEENRSQAKDAIRADTAYIMTSLLRGVVERGTAVRAQALGRPIAGKTGTTNDFTDAWFIGFEPSLCAGVWVGFDEKKDSLGQGRDGGPRRPAHLARFLEAPDGGEAGGGVLDPRQHRLRARGRDGPARARGHARGADGGLRGRDRAPLLAGPGGRPVLTPAPRGPYPSVRRRSLGRLEPRGLPG